MFSEGKVRVYWENKFVKIDLQKSFTVDKKIWMYSLYQIIPKYSF